MSRVAERVYLESSVQSLGQEIALLDDIFTLVNESELKIAEEKYASYSFNAP